MHVSSISFGYSENGIELLEVRSLMCTINKWQYKKLSWIEQDNEQPTHVQQLVQTCYGYPGANYRADSTQES
jgi:hypothetical protein